MTARKRSTRTDTKAGATLAMKNAQAAAIDLPPHLHLRDGDRPFFDAIIGARARDQWDEVDIAHAVNLARTQADVERLQQVLDCEGHVVRNDRGTSVANPVHSVLETLSRRAVSLSRMLHVHPEAKVGESREQGRKLKKQRTAAESLDKAKAPTRAGDVPLIAGHGATH